jgi:hypothetical protein
MATREVGANRIVLAGGLLGGIALIFARRGYTRRRATHRGAARRRTTGSAAACIGRSTPHRPATCSASSSAWTRKAPAKSSASRRACRLGSSGQTSVSRRSAASRTSDGAPRCAGLSGNSAVGFAAATGLAVWARIGLIYSAGRASHQTEPRRYDPQKQNPPVHWFVSRLVLREVARQPVATWSCELKQGTGAYLYITKRLAASGLTRLEELI